MTTPLFPVLPGLTFSRMKYPEAGATIIQQSASGKETRLTLRSRARWIFELTYSILRAAQGAPMFGKYTDTSQMPNMARALNDSTLVDNEFAVLCGFFMEQQGAYNEWLFEDVKDNTVGLYQFGWGDGMSTGFASPFTSAWQALLVGGSLPVVYTDQSEYVDRALNTFAEDTTATISANGTVSFVSPPYGRQPLYLAAQNATPANSAKLYLGEQFAVATGIDTAYQLTRTIGGFAQGYSEPITDLNGSPTIWDNGIRVPTANYSVSSKGIVTFTGVPPVNHILSWAGKFYFRCRFKQDTNQFEQFAANFYRAQRVEAISIIR